MNNMGGEAAEKIEELNTEQKSYFGANTNQETF